MLLAPCSSVLLIAAFLLIGCAMERTVLDQSVVDAYPDPMDELDFLDELETKRVVTNHDALHALLLIVDPDDTPQDFHGRVARARERGWISERKELAPNESARLGMIAVAVCEILDIKGGVTMRVFGLSPRYATRELVYLRMVPNRTENQSLSGLEFIELLSRVEARGGAKEPVRDLDPFSPAPTPGFAPEPEPEHEHEHEPDAESDAEQARAMQATEFSP